MYKLSRLFLISSLLVGFLGLALLVDLTTPWSAIVLVVLLLADINRRRRQWALSAHGTARVANLDDLRRAGMIDAQSGLILGRVEDDRRPLSPALRTLFDLRVSSRSACRQFFRALQRHPRLGSGELVRLNRTTVHSVIFAPTGSGKGVSCILPFLLTSPDSCIVVDFKGENAKLTARHRRRVFGHRTVILDPFKVVTERPDTLNPLVSIGKTDPGALDDIRTFSEAMVIRSGQEREPHWCDSAELWIASMIGCVSRYAPDDDRSLQAVRELLTDPKKMATAIQLLSASDDEFLARMGHQLTHFTDKELSATLTTTNRFLRFLDTPAISASTRVSSFDPADLRRGRMTVYLVLPPEHMRASMGLLRLWVGSLMRAVVRGGLQEEKKIHFVLDEAASLGSGMNALNDAVDKYRAYGIRCQFYYQSMGQLKMCWPEDQGQTLLSNTAQTFFGVNDLPTAEYVSSRLGDATIVVTSGGSNKGRSSTIPTGGYEPNQGSRGESSGENDNWSQMGRRLCKPDEVLNLDPRTAITFVPGVQPVVTRLLRYFEERALRSPPGLIRRTLSSLKTLAHSLALLFLISLFTLAMADYSLQSFPAITNRSPPAPKAKVAPTWPAGNAGWYSDNPSPASKGR